MSEELTINEKTELEIKEKTQIQKSYSRFISNLNLITGSKKIFTPEQLGEQAIEYFSYCISNPIQSKQLITGGQAAGTVKTLEKPRMFTLEGFCLFAGVNTAYIRQLEQQIEGKTDEESVRYSTIIKLIRDAIRNQRFELAAVNDFNPMFIAKLEGLADKIEHAGEIKNTVTQIEFIQRSVEDTTYTEVQDEIDNI